MSSIKTKTKKTGEEMLAEAPNAVRTFFRFLLALKDTEFREDMDIVVKAIVEEYKYYCPSYRRRIYTYLMDRAIRAKPPFEITEEFDSEHGRKTFNYCIEKFNTGFGDLPEIVQAIIFNRLLKSLEPEEAEYEKEEARQNAFDEVLDALSEWTTEELVYFAGQIKSGALDRSLIRLVS